MNKLLLSLIFLSFLSFLSSFFVLTTSQFVEYVEYDYEYKNQCEDLYIRNKWISSLYNVYDIYDLYPIIDRIRKEISQQIYQMCLFNVYK